MSVSNTSNTTTDDYAARLNNAAEEYIARRDLNKRPAGRNDSGGRWYPATGERCDCCGSIRSPSRAWPATLFKHCRSVEHVANLFSVNPTDLRRAARAAAKGGV